LKAGEACLLPRHQINAIRSGPGPRWTFCWVRYHEGDDQVPMASGHSPTVGRCSSGHALKHAIEGLRAECLHGMDPVVTRMWIELVQKYVVAFALPRMKDPRIARAWDEACRDLSRPWTLRALAQIAHVSPEHFRRLCIVQFGRTPMKHLTHLRMRHAAELLTSSQEKIETIAHLAGFQNPFTFSNTFLTWTGFRPSEYRGKKREND
jgi:AraC-like DNA-binding protein